MFAYDEVRKQVLEDMPPPQIREESRVLGEAAPKPKPTGRRKKQDQESALLDLMGDGPETSSPAPQAGGGNADLLQSILGGFDSTPASGTASPAPGQQPKSNVSNILDLFNSPSPVPQAAPQSNAASLLGDLGGAPAAPATPQPGAPPVLSAYSKNNLEITLQLQRTADGTVNILAKFHNTSFTDGISGVNLQAAVPKSQKLQLQPISTSEIGPGRKATQMMRVLGSKAVSVAHPGRGESMLMCFSHRCVCV